jgi:hypothetical protein
VRIVCSTVEQRAELAVLLRGVDPQHLCRTAGTHHLLRLLRKGRMRRLAVWQQVHAVAQHRRAQPLERAPHAHAWRGAVAGQTDYQ